MIVQRRSNSHSHVSYFLAKPVHRGPTAREAPLRLFARISEFYRQALGADPGYNGVLTHNPMRSAHRHGEFLTHWGCNRPYSLSELAEPIPRGWRLPVWTHSPLPRYPSLFTHLLILPQDWRYLMSLYEIWKENPAQIREKRVDQIIGFAGDGKLGDNNSAPAEFRAFLARVPSEVLAGYADDCLSRSFTDSGPSASGHRQRDRRKVGVPRRAGALSGYQERYWSRRHLDRSRRPRGGRWRSKQPMPIVFRSRPLPGIARSS